MSFHKTSLSLALRASWLQLTGRPLRFYHIYVATQGGPIAYGIPFATASLLRHDVIADAVHGGAILADERRFVVFVERIEAAEYRALTATTSRVKPLSRIAA